MIVIMFIICHSLKIVPSLLEILGYPPEVCISIDNFSKKIRVKTKARIFGHFYL